MQQIISKDDLIALGISLPSDQLDMLVEHANTTLFERIGTEITNSFDDQKLEEFVTVQESDDDAKTSEWLSENVPDLKEIIEDERDIVLGEVAENTSSFS